jgi:hypothetical protein
MLHHPFVVEDWAALDNKHVQSALQGTYEICASDDAYYHPEQTRGRVSSMLSEHNQMIMEEWKKHRDDVLQGNATTANTKLCVLQLAPRKVDTQVSILNDRPDDLFDAPGYRTRLKYAFDLDAVSKQALEKSVRALYDELLQSEIGPSERGLEEENEFHERDDCDVRLTEAEQTGLQILEERESGIKGEERGTNGLPL